MAALLGAEEFGFATAPLVVSGCVMMRVCHLDTCPVGIATQNPELRKHFSRASGVRRDLLPVHRRGVPRAPRGTRASARSPKPSATSRASTARRRIDHYWKAGKLDLRPHPGAGRRARHERAPSDDATRTTALTRPSTASSSRPAALAIDEGRPTALERPIRNVHRAVGTMLGSEVTRRYGGAGLPDGTISLTFRGSAGQSFGAFVPRGITMTLVGDANDYLGKGLSGGIIVGPPARGVAVSGRGADHRRQRRAVRGDVGRGLHPGPGRRAVLRPQLRRPRRRRGSRRPRLRVHDRRHRARARPDGSQLRGRDVRWRRLRARPRQACCRGA